MKAPADAQKRLPARHQRPDQRQGDRITAPVKGTVGRGFRLAVFAGMDIGATAGQQEPVAEVKQFLHRHKARVRRDDQRQPARHLRHRFGIHAARDMGVKAVIDQMRVADDADDRSVLRAARHGSVPE